MQTFREMLKEVDLTLYLALENSWKIAREEWTPMLKMESESHGGLPHLESVEHWMDKIAESCRPIWNQHSDTPFGFNPLEIYMALCAALFHDIGRGRKTDDHGKTSQEIIKENWAQLGIISGRVAHELGHICAFHTSEQGWTEHDAVKIHPWGIVHTEAIASLLTLADELDTAYTRAAPQYMKEPDLLFDLFRDDDKVELSKMENMADDYFTKGLYRDFISDVDLDPGSHLIKTVLFSDRLPGKACITGKCGSAEWLSSIISEPPAMQNFTPKDYFFNYLEYLRRNVHSEVLDFHANQFYKALDFKRANMIKKLRIPSKYGDKENLIYDLQLWDRQMTGMSRSARDRIRKDTEDLSNTIELIKNTIKGIDTLISKRPKQDNTAFIFFPKPNSSSIDAKELLGTIGNYIRYLKNRQWIIDNEAQQGLDVTRKSLEELSNKLSTPNFDPEIDRKMEPATEAIGGILGLSKESTISAKEAHARLIDILHYLIYADLYNEQLPREWASWTVEDFHQNLLLAFHIYLANVRQLDSDCLDYRYLGRGGVERPFENKPLKECKIIDSFGYLIEYKKDQKPSSKVDCDELYNKATGNLFNELDSYLKLCKKAGGDHSMPAADFRLSVKLIFMQWLSGDISTKNKQLKRIKRGLQKLEIPFDEWLVEYNNHLFNNEWKLSLEPSLKRTHIENISEKVFELSGNLHLEDKAIPWETLAAALRYPKMERVRTGAVRLSNLLRIYSDLPEVFSKAMSETTNQDWNLTFGHLLLAELEDKNQKNNTPRAVSLDTSHSAWRLEVKKDSVQPESVQNFLAGVRESRRV